MKILVATKNRGKIGEFAEMMRDFGIEWLGLEDVGVTKDVEETGQTFYENAVLKGTTYAQESGCYVLADDSGLVVDALDGAPGVYTARYGGPHLTAVERYTLLLKNMQGIPAPQRTARFCCVIVLAGPNGRLLASTEGVCEGRIAEVAVGKSGFGYDPVFYIPALGQTMAQLSAAEKHQISHRGQALRKIVPYIRGVLT